MRTHQTADPSTTPTATAAPAPTLLTISAMWTLGLLVLAAQLGTMGLAHFDRGVTDAQALTVFKVGLVALVAAAVLASTPRKWLARRHTTH